MCGIVGYIGKNVKQTLISSLKKLEYRGYDSAGIAWKENKEIFVVKKSGQIENLEKSVNFNSDLTSSGIAHTRWATHGNANETNAHPHLSMSGTFSIVHNGIIENFLELKDFLIKNNYRFLSETDSEVIANLLEFEYKKCENALKAITNATEKLKGSYALAILTNFDENVYLAKKDMPLYIDKTNKICASDINAFIKETKDIYSLENGELAIMMDNKVSFYYHNKKISKKRLLAESMNEENTLNNYSHYMLKEIEEINDKINKTILNFKENNKLNTILNEVDHVCLIACGTAYHACLNGEKFLIKYAKINASSHIASEFYLFPPILNNRTLCIFISQSGETADTINCLKIAKKHGAKTMVITNVKTSTITRLSNINFFTEAGPEIAVASTKAYNTQVALLYKIVENICKCFNKRIKKLDCNRLKINYIYEKNKEYYELAKRVLNYEKIFFMGRNFDYISSLEGSLKLKEITYINCQAISCGELKHGTLALIDDKCLVITLITEKDKLEKTLNNVNEILARGGNVIIISPFISNIKSKIKNGLNVEYLSLPNIHNNFYPLTSIIPLQYLAYYVALLKGNNPDKPRNLAKSVTVE